MTSKIKKIQKLFPCPAEGVSPFWGLRRGVEGAGPFKKIFML